MSCSLYNRECNGQAAHSRSSRSAACERRPVTELLKQLSGGDREAFDRLVPLVYDQLRKLASRSLRSERPDHTLRATALVHEAYLRLADAGGDWQDRVHFYAVAARVMRRILVDHAKAAKRQKRGGGVEHIAFDEAVLVGPTPPRVWLSWTSLYNAWKCMTLEKARWSNCCISVG